MQEITQTFNDIFGSSYGKPVNLETLNPWSKAIAIENTKAFRP